MDSVNKRQFLLNYPNVSRLHRFMIVVSMQLAETLKDGINFVSNVAVPGGLVINIFM